MYFTHEGSTFHQNIYPCKGVMVLDSDLEFEYCKVLLVHCVRQFNLYIMHCYIFILANEPLITRLCICHICTCLITSEKYRSMHLLVLFICMKYDRKVPLWRRSSAYIFFYKHSVFQSEARIWLSFSQIQSQNMLKICLSKNIEKSKFHDLTHA